MFWLLVFLSFPEVDLGLDLRRIEEYLRHEQFQEAVDYSKPFLRKNETIARHSLCMIYAH